jgi:hypothetical protein
MPRLEPKYSDIHASYQPESTSKNTRSYFLILMRRIFMLPLVTKQWQYEGNREQAQDILSFFRYIENANVGKIGQGEARHRKYKRLKLVGGQA